MHCMCCRSMKTLCLWMYPQVLSDIKQFCLPPLARHLLLWPEGDRHTQPSSDHQLTLCLSYTLRETSLIKQWEEKSSVPRVSSVKSFVFRRTRFNDFVDGVCVVQFLDLKRDAYHNFLSGNKNNCNLITCSHFFLVDGHWIKLVLESESCRSTNISRATIFARPGVMLL
jgi:hypothetical protein